MDPNSPTHALSNWLQLVRDALQNEWIRNFLLNESAGASDLEILTSTVCAQHALAGTVKLDLYDERDGIIPRCRSSWLFVPAFTYRKYSALLFAMDGAKAPGSRLLRIIRDNETGTMISVFVPEESEFVQIQIHVTDNKTRNRLRSYFELKQSVLEGGNIIEMWNSVQYHLYYNEKLYCGQCNNDCSCTIPDSVRPQHRMDLAITPKNLSSMRGHFSGVCTLSRQLE